MAKRVFLHVGTTKSGTTFLQRVLWAHRERLLADGLLLPGRGSPDHFSAALDVREEPFRATQPALVTGSWQRLVDEMAAWQGDALLSHELFAPASAAQVARAMASLDGAEVHVIVTARDLVRQVPSEWQEHLKHRSALTFREFIDSVRTDQRGPFSPNGYHFWDQQQLGELLSRWGQVPPSHVHVVTVPRHGAAHDLLWKRFTSVIGIDGEGFDLKAARFNPSLGGEQAELIRRLNSTLGPRLPLPGPYTPMVKTLLARQVLAGRPGTDIALPAQDHAFVAERARDIVAEVERFSPHVVGDLAELIPGPPPPEHASEDNEVPVEAVLGEAVEALADLLELLAAERARNRRLRQRLTSRARRRRWFRLRF